MLADLSIEQRPVVTKGGSFHVKGLSFVSLTTLIRTHLPDLEALFDLWQQSDAVKDSDIEVLALTLAEQAPGFVANAIALAAGEPEQADVAEKLPFPVQVQALTDIFELTFDDVGGIKKFLPTVAKLLGATGAMKKIEATMKKGR